MCWGSFQSELMILNGKLEACPLQVGRAPNLRKNLRILGSCS